MPKAMKWIRTGFDIVMGLTMIVALVFINVVLWLIEADEKNPSREYPKGLK